MDALQTTNGDIFEVHKLLEPLRSTKLTLEQMLDKAIELIQKRQIQAIHEALSILEREKLPNAMRYDELLVIAAFYPPNDEVYEFFMMDDWKDMPYTIKLYQDEVFGSSNLRRMRTPNASTIFISDVAQSLRLNPFDTEQAFKSYSEYSLVREIRRGSYGMEPSVRKYLQSVALSRLSDETKSRLGTFAKPVIDMIELETLEGCWNCSVRK